MCPEGLAGGFHVPSRTVAQEAVLPHQAALTRSDLCLLQQKDQQARSKPLQSRTQANCHHTATKAAPNAQTSDSQK